MIHIGLYIFSALIHASACAINTDFVFKPYISITTVSYPSTFENNILLAADIARDSPDPFFVVSGSVTSAGSQVGKHRTIDEGGTTINEHSNVCAVSATVNYLGAWVYLVMCVDSNAVRFRVSKLGSDKAILLDASLSVPHLKSVCRSSYIKTNSSIVVSGSTGLGDIYFYKFDSSVFSFVLSVKCTVVSSTVGKSVVQIVPTSSNEFVAIGNFQFLVSSSDTSMSAFREISTDCVFDIIMFHASSGFYASCLMSGQFIVRRMDVSTSTATDNTPFVSVSNRVHNMKHIPNLPFLITADQTTVRYWTADLAPLDTTLGMAKASVNSYVEVVTTGPTSYLTGFSRSTNPMTFIPVRLDFGNCVAVVVGADTSCSKCLSGYYLSDYKVCVKIPFRSGLVVNTQSIRSCSDGCDACNEDYTICTRCSKDFYMISGVCVFFEDIPVGLGVDGETREVGECSVDRCRVCRGDRKECTECEGGVYKNKSDGRCVDNDVDGYGVLQGMEVDRCVVRNCKDCRSSVVDCVGCMQGFYMIGNDSTVCYENVLDGYGAHEDGKRIVRCTEAGCAKCYDDYMTCTSCLEGYSLSLEAKCSVAGKISIVGKRVEGGGIVLTYDGEVRLNGSVVKVESISRDNLSSGMVNFEVSLLHGDSVRIDVSTHVSCSGCRMRVSGLRGVVVGENGEYSDDIVEIEGGNPTVNEDYGVFNHPKTQTALRSTTLSIQAISFIMIITGQSRVQLIRIIDEFEVYLYINGRRIKQTDAFVRLFSYEVWNIIPNILSKNESEHQCRNSESMRAKFPSCNIFNNNGSQMIGFTLIALSILLCIVLAKTVGSCRGKKEEGIKMMESSERLPSKHSLPSEKKRPYVKRMASNVFNNVASLATLVRLYDSMMIDNTLYAYININYVSIDALSIVLSISIVLSYVLISVWMASNVSRMKKGVCDTTTTKQVDTKKIGILGYMYKEYKSFDSSSFYVYIPLVETVGTIVSQFIVVFMEGENRAQLWVLLMIECIKVTVIVKYRQYRNLITNIEEIITRISMCSIYALHLIYQYIDHPNMKTEIGFSVLTLILFVVIILASFLPTSLFSKVKSGKVKLNEEPKTKHAKLEQKADVKEPTLISKKNKVGLTISASYAKKVKHSVNNLDSRIFDNELSDKIEPKKSFEPIENNSQFFPKLKRRNDLVPYSSIEQFKIHMLKKRKPSMKIEMKNSSKPSLDKTQEMMI